MKKLISIVLMLALVLSLCACGGAGGSVESTEEKKTETIEKIETTKESEITTPEVIVPEDEETIYTLGDVIETSLFKITPSFTGYAYELANWPDENYMTPAGDFSGSSPYSADEGKTEMYGEIQIEYIGNEKSDVELTVDISANYDDGYMFEGQDVHTGYCFSLDGDWKYDERMTFEPLSDATTRIMRYCIEVPEQVETNTDKSLLVTFTVNDESFVYDFRSAEVLGSDYDPRAEFYAPVDEETEKQIIAYLKTNGLEEIGWYDTTVGVYTFTFDDTSVTATLPINSSYQYDFSGTYEVFSGTILISWNYGEQMHLDYTFDGTTLDIVAFEHDR